MHVSLSRQIILVVHNGVVAAAVLVLRVMMWSELARLPLKHLSSHRFEERTRSIHSKCLNFNLLVFEAGTRNEMMILASLLENSARAVHIDGGGIGVPVFVGVGLHVL